MRRRDVGWFVALIAGLAVVACLAGAVVLAGQADSRANRLSDRLGVVLESNANLSKTLAAICADPRAKKIPACSVVSNTPSTPPTTTPSSVTPPSTTTTVPNRSRSVAPSDRTSNTTPATVEAPGTVTRTITVPAPGGTPRTIVVTQPADPTTATVPAFPPTTQPGLVQSLLGALGL